MYFLNYIKVHYLFNIISKVYLTIFSD